MIGGGVVIACLSFSKMCWRSSRIGVVTVMVGAPLLGGVWPCAAIFWSAVNGCVPGAGCKASLAEVDVGVVRGTSFLSFLVSSESSLNSSSSGLGGVSEVVGLGSGNSEGLGMPVYCWRGLGVCSGLRCW